MRSSLDVSAPVSTALLDAAGVSRTAAPGEAAPAALAEGARSGGASPHSVHHDASPSDHALTPVAGPSGAAGHQAGSHRGAAAQAGPAGFSLLRLSLGGRLLIAAGLLAPLWAAVYLVVR